MPQSDTSTATDQDELDENVEIDENSKDETLDDDHLQDDEGDTEDKDEGDSSDSDKTEEEDAPEFKKAFSNIQGDTPDEYIPNLEESYRSSSREAKRLAQANKDLQAKLDAISAAAEKDPDLAKKLQDGTGDKDVVVDPAIQYARTQMEQSMEKDYNNFVKAHPEAESDPEVQEALLAELSVIGEVYRKKGVTLTMAQGLQKAWASLGRDASDSKEKLAAKAKDIGSQSKVNNGSKKPAPKGKTVLTAEQIAVGKKMGLTEEKLRAQYEKK